MSDPEAWVPPPGDTIVTVNRTAFSLVVRVLPKSGNRYEVTRRYPVAIGAEGYRTEPGIYVVEVKAKDPEWMVPDSQWAIDAGLKPGTVVAGGAPNNPIRERWIELANGQGIHGTFAEESIGTRASHGCIRMLPDDVIDLYPRVPKGSRVFIV